MNVVKAAWNIFGKSYEYRKKYNEYKAKRMYETKQSKKAENTQMSFENLEVLHEGISSL